MGDNFIKKFKNNGLEFLEAYGSISIFVDSVVNNFKETILFFVEVFLFKYFFKLIETDRAIAVFVEFLKGLL